MVARAGTAGSARLARRRPGSLNLRCGGQRTCADRL